MVHMILAILWAIFLIYKKPAKIKFLNQILHIICLVNEFIVSNAAVNDIKLDMF